MREKEGKFSYATGADGYRWLEAEDVKEKREDDIDLRYGHSLIDEAIATIAEFGDVEWFREEAVVN